MIVAAPPTPLCSIAKLFMSDSARIFLFLAIGLLPCFGAPTDRVEFLNNEALQKIVGTNNEYAVWYVSKLPSNDGFYALYHVDGKPTQCFLIPFSSMRVSKILKCPGFCGYLNKSHEFVAWTSDFAHEMSFPSVKIDLNRGDSPPPNDIERCEFDSLGEYFALEKSYSVSLFSVGEPKGKSLITFPNRTLQKLFSTDDRLFLFLESTSNGKIECTIISKRNMRILRRFDLPNIKKFFDLSPDGTKLLVGTPGNWMYGDDPPYRHYIIDLSSLKQTRVYQDGEYGFFLP